jgi:hypothetical protein
MTDRTRMLSRITLFLAATVLLLTPRMGIAQTTQSAQASQPSQTAKGDRWLHVRVDCSDPKGERVRVNVPLELAEKVIGSINHHHLRAGKISINSADVHGVDLRAILDAVRTSKDGEFVTVQSNEEDVRVAKQNGQLLINVNKKQDKKDHAEIRVPMKVVDALLSAGKDELDIAAALRVLSAQGDTELVSVKDSENTIRIWLDSKNEAD